MRCSFLVRSLRLCGSNLCRYFQMIYGAEQCREYSREPKFADFVKKITESAIFVLRRVKIAVRIALTSEMRRDAGT